MVSWEFTGNGRFRRRSPENGFGDDFSQWRNSGVPVGRSIATAANSPANSHAESGRTGTNREIRQFSHTIAREPANTGLPYFGCHSVPPQRRRRRESREKTQMPHATASAVLGKTKNPHRDVQCGLSVELGGFEPPTPSMPWRCATSCAIAPVGLQLSGPFFADLVYNTSAACDVKIDHAIGVSFFAKRRAPGIRCARR